MVEVYKEEDEEKRKEMEEESAMDLQSELNKKYEQMEKLLQDFHTLVSGWNEKMDKTDEEKVTIHREEKTEIREEKASIEQVSNAEDETMIGGKNIMKKDETQDETDSEEADEIKT